MNKNGTSYNGGHTASYGSELNYQSGSAAAKELESLGIVPPFSVWMQPGSYSDTFATRDFQLEISPAMGRSSTFSYGHDNNLYALCIE